MILAIRNRQRIRRVNNPLFRRIVRAICEELTGMEDYELGVHLVGGSEITRLNETFLRHAGPTDVIAFDYAVGRASNLSSRTGILPKRRIAAGWKPALHDRLEACPVLHGEIFVCVDEAISQARRFRTSWQSELVRYVIHGALHLCGFDDQRPAARRQMKREENRLLRLLADRFPLSRLAGKSTLRA